MRTQEKWSTCWKITTLHPVRAACAAARSSMCARSHVRWLRERARGPSTVRLKLSERLIYAGMILISSSSSGACARARAHLSSVPGCVRKCSRACARHGDAVSHCDIIYLEIYYTYRRERCGVVRRAEPCTGARIVIIITRQNGGLCKSRAFNWSAHLIGVCAHAHSHTLHLNR